MKKLTTLAVAVFLGVSVGCGVEGTDPSDAAADTTPEQTTTEIEQAMESGEIDATSYGDSAPAGGAAPSAPQE